MAYPFAKYGAEHHLKLLSGLGIQSLEYQADSSTTMDWSVNAVSLILASRSNRRAQLLREAGYPFAQVWPPFDDPPQPNAQLAATPAALAIRLAVAKAHSVLNDNVLNTSTPAMILAADTLMVGPNGRLIGQPADRHDAQMILQTLIDATHDVYTGVAIFDDKTRRAITTFADHAQVHLDPVTPEQLTAYVDSGQWQGKAGGYNLFSLGPHWTWTVKGDPSTVVGLPLTKLSPWLAPCLAQIHHADPAADRSCPPDQRGHVD